MPLELSDVAKFLSINYEFPGKSENISLLNCSENLIRDLIKGSEKESYRQGSFLHGPTTPEFPQLYEFLRIEGLYLTGCIMLSGLIKGLTLS